MKLISLNIEGQKHFSQVLPFIARESGDIVCLQEIFQTDIPKMEAMGYTCVFLPMTLKPENGGCVGIALCIRGKIENTKFIYYRNADIETKVFDPNNKSNTVRNGIIFADCTIENTTHSIGTTHFTWTPHGELPSDEQKTDMKIFESKLREMKPHIMCGDFNIPRLSSSLYKKLTEHYTDCIPLTYSSSLDANLHRLGKMPDKKIIFDTFMVDYILSQSPYDVNDVRLEFGISDHAAVVAAVEKQTI